MIDVQKYIDSFRKDWEPKIRESIQVGKEFSLSMNFDKMFIPNEMIDAAFIYFYRTVPKLVSLIEGPEISNSELALVLTDYNSILLGMYNSATPPEVMRKVLGKLTESEAFITDKYALYVGMHVYYTVCLSAHKKITELYEANAEDIAVTFRKNLNQWEYLTVPWIYGQKLIKDKLFESSRACSEYTEDFMKHGDAVQYFVYRVIAQECFNVSQEILDRITLPKLLVRVKKEIIDEFYIDQKTAIDNLLAETAKKYAAAAEGINDDPKIVRIPIKLGMICAAPVKAREEDETFTQSLQIYIDKYKKQYPKSRVTVQTCEQVLDGLVPLQVKMNKKPNEGLLVYDTTLGEYSDLIGGYDTGGKRQQDILDALRVLNNLYISVPGDLKYHREIKVLTVHLYEKEREGQDPTIKLKISVSAQLMNAKAIALQGKAFFELKRQTPGTIARRFRNRIIVSTHYGEDDFLDDLYEYQIKKASANNSEELRKVNIYIQNHGNEHKRKINSMFCNYEEKGYIKNVQKYKGDYNEFIYSWEKGPNFAYIKQKDSEENETENK